jgi:hypothetical protein
MDQDWKPIDVKAAPSNGQSPVKLDHPMDGPEIKFHFDLVYFFVEFPVQQRP